MRGRATFRRELLRTWQGMSPSQVSAPSTKIQQDTRTMDSPFVSSGEPGLTDRRWQKRCERTKTSSMSCSSRVAFRRFLAHCVRLLRFLAILHLLY